MNTVIAAFQNLEVLSNFPVKCQNLLEKKKDNYIMKNRFII